MSVIKQAGSLIKGGDGKYRMERIVTKLVGDEYRGPG